MQLLWRILVFCTFFLSNATAMAGAPVDSGTLDASFGVAGRVKLTVAPFNQPTGATLIANDVVVQPDGKILLAGYASNNGQSEWIVIRLNSNGSYDTSFGIGANGIAYFYVFGPTDNQAASIALRSNGKIVVGGTIKDSNNNLVTAVAVQLNGDGSFDTTWGNGGAVYFTPAAGDASKTRAIAIDTIDQYALGSVYLVGQYTHGASGNNDFFYAGISADGKNKVSNSFEASLGGNYNDSATSVAVQPGTGNVIVGGYSTSAAGDTDCAVISTVIVTLPAFLEADLYRAFGSNGVSRVGFNLGDNNNDYCDAMTLTKQGYVLLGGHGSKVTTGVAYQAGISALFDNNGQLQTHVSSGIYYPDTFSFTYDGTYGRGSNNTINKLLLENYDTRNPKFLAAGYGFDSAMQPYTTNDFGIGRLEIEGYQGIIADTSFGWGADHTGFDMIDFSQQCGATGCSYNSNDVATSAAFDPAGRLLVVGATSDASGGTDIAIVRFAPFDGIFTNSFELPNY